MRLRWKDGGEGGDHRPTRPDEPAKTITRNTHSDGALLVLPNHQPHYADAPAKVITAGDGQGAKRALVINPRHPPAQADAPAPTVTARDRGGQGANVLAWPWERPSTALCARETLAPPGRNGRAGTSQDTAPGAVKLSERAAAILQGFPDHWAFCGETKKSRWSQLGMAMPPPLAHAVASAIMKWFKETDL